METEDKKIWKFTSSYILRGIAIIVGLVATWTFTLSLIYASFLSMERIQTNVVIEHEEDIERLEKEHEQELDKIYKSIEEKNLKTNDRLDKITGRNKDEIDKLKQRK